MIFIRFFYIVFFVYLTSCSTTYAIKADKNYTKITAQGEYINFPGVTIISPIDQTDAPFFSELFSALKGVEGVPEHYALLPVSSMHMTTNNLYTALSKKNWVSLIKSKTAQFVAINQSLKETAFRPTATIDRIVVSTTLKLAVNIPIEQDEIIRSVGRAHQIESKIPKYHITLGYLYRSMSKEKHEELTLKVKNAFKSFIQKNGYQRKVFTLGQPALSTFNNMSSYSPWDGITPVF